MKKVIDKRGISLRLLLPLSYGYLFLGESK